MKGQNIPSTDAPHAHAGWSATWTGNVNGVINPSLSDLSAPHIQFTADFAEKTMSAGITCKRGSNRTAPLDTWTGVPYTRSFSLSVLSGTFQEVRVVNSEGQGAIVSNYDGSTILGRVQTQRIVGVYRADR